MTTRPRPHVRRAADALVAAARGRPSRQGPRRRMRCRQLAGARACPAALGSHSRARGCLASVTQSTPIWASSSAASGGGAQKERLARRWPARSTGRDAALEVDDEQVRLSRRGDDLGGERRPPRERNSVGHRTTQHRVAGQRDPNNGHVSHRINTQRRATRPALAEPKRGRAAAASTRRAWHLPARSTRWQRPLSAAPRPACRIRCEAATGRRSGPKCPNSTISALSEVAGRRAGRRCLQAKASAYEPCTIGGSRTRYRRNT
jgi:hypothetical protein